MLNPETIKTIIEAVHYWAGVDITSEQIGAVLAFEPGFESEIRKFGFDTAERETFIDALARYAGYEEGWPRGADSDARRNRFYNEFPKMARARGFKLAVDRWGEP